MDVALTPHRNISTLLLGSLYRLPLADQSLDLITCRMVVEHLDQPVTAFTEAARCLRPGGALIVMTPYLLNYGVLGNAIATKLMPENLRLRLVHQTDARADEDIFPVRYKANTMRSLTRALHAAGLQIHTATKIQQHRAYFRKLARIEYLLTKATPNNGLLVCAHRSPA